ncbi:MAG: hydrogenase expression/formation protein HypE [Isosphaeraceae bacterium]
MTQPFDIEKRSCPLPLRDYPHIVMGHGAGGKLSAELVEQLFLPAFRNEPLERLADAAVLPGAAGRLAFSTDSYVVRPLFFPGGSIGDLAVNGTVNDLAMVGARPLYLSAGFIIEEGFAMEELWRVVQAMAAAAREAGVPVVTGDTKVVDRGHGDGCYINTAGVGRLDDHVELSPSLVRAGDAVIVSGTIADHGMAVMSVREGLEFEAVIASDTAPLHTLVQSMLASRAGIRVLRDPTRGGVASALNELAASARVGMLIEETSVPIHPATQSACELLGLDPLLVANEGKLLAIVARDDAQGLLSVMREHRSGRQAEIIGRVTAEHPGIVAVRTAIGGKRVLAPMVGEQLPRIC